MKNLTTLLLTVGLSMLILISCHSSSSKATSENDSELQNTEANTQTSSTADNSNLADFWRDFKNAAITKDYKKVTEFTAFPFLNHGYYMMSKTEFKSFAFADNIITALKTAKLPVKSNMEFAGGVDDNGNLVDVNFAKGTLYEVDCDGPALYFSKIGEEWKFVAILYGE